MEKKDDDKEENDNEFGLLSLLNFDDDNDEYEDQVLEEQVESNHDETMPSTSDDNDDDDVPPTFLMTAILAGLYELAPFHILRHQTGWGRRIQYNKVTRLKSNFELFQQVQLVTHIPSQSPPCPDDGDPNTVVANLRLERMLLTRYFFDGKNTDNRSKRTATKCADFYVYRVHVDVVDGTNDNCHFNHALKQLTFRERKENPEGLQVSNAGGTWHGRPHFFETPSTAKDDAYEWARTFLHHVCSRAVSEIADHDEGLLLEARDVECWANIAPLYGSCWNRLHTHKGSAWSGVYYVESDTNNCGYGGRLVLKPTPHFKEKDDLSLDPREAKRFQSSKDVREDDPFASSDCCTYVDIDPSPGTIIVFPSWLHHCVLPTPPSLRHDDTNKNQECHDSCDSFSLPKHRISIAFNINFED